MNDKKDFSVENYFHEQQNVISRIEISSIYEAINVIKDIYEKNKKILICGNGGSALTASHYVTDWMKMVNLKTKKKFRVVSLTDNHGLLTAYGNDIGFDQIFSGQLEAIMDEGDLVIGISGSGNSRNVLNAIEYANNNKGLTLGIVGYDGGVLKKMAQKSVWVPSMDMQICEDIHLMFGHLVMKKLCESSIIAVR